MIKNSRFLLIFAKRQGSHLKAYSEWVLNTVLTVWCLWVCVCVFVCKCVCDKINLFPVWRAQVSYRGPHASVTCRECCDNNKLNWLAVAAVASLFSTWVRVSWQKSCFPASPLLRWIQAGQVNGPPPSHLNSGLTFVKKKLINKTIMTILSWYVPTFTTLSTLSSSVILAILGLFSNGTQKQVVEVWITYLVF